MEYAKPIWLIENELKQVIINVYYDAMTGEECAEMFVKLDQTTQTSKK